MNMIKNLIVGYLALNFFVGVPNVKYGLQLKWPSAALVVLTAPFYSLTWLASPKAAEKIFSPLYWYEDPHYVSTGRELVRRQPDGSWK